MKAIMISVKPKHCANILNGFKTIEVRKTKPNCELPIDVYIYCTKDSKHKLEYCDINEGYWSANDGGDYYNGKVVAKFTLNKVEEIEFSDDDCLYYAETLDAITLLEETCLLYGELDYYLLEKKGYAIHINDLEIFDRPKELSEFKTKDKEGSFKKPIKINAVKYLTKAPQSWCYVESED